VLIKSPPSPSSPSSTAVRSHPFLTPLRPSAPRYYEIAPWSLYFLTTPSSSHLLYFPLPSFPSRGYYSRCLGSALLIPASLRARKGTEATYSWPSHPGTTHPPSEGLGWWTSFRGVFWPFFSLSFLLLTLELFD